MMSSSHRWRSRSRRSSTSAGGAATSTLYFHNRSGCPSPTFLYATSTSLPHDVTDTQPLNLSRDSCVITHASPSVTQYVKTRAAVHSCVSSPTPVSKIHQYNCYHRLADGTIPGEPGLAGCSSISSSICSPGWLHGSVIERRSLDGELSLSCARPVADS